MSGGASKREKNTAGVNANKCSHHLFIENLISTQILIHTEAHAPDTQKRTCGMCKDAYVSVKYFLHMKKVKKKSFRKSPSEQLLRRKV